MPSIQIRWTALSFFALPLLLGSGCSSAPPRGQVSGVVQCKGQKLANVVVTFVPDPDAGHKGPRASGVTNAQGEYALQGEDDQEGAIIGAYRVIVDDLNVYSLPRSPDGTLLKPAPVRFPAKYSDPLQSPLRKQVQQGTQSIDIEL
jgi:hypothetical protein